MAKIKHPTREGYVAEAGRQTESMRLAGVCANFGGGVCGFAQRQ